VLLGDFFAVLRFRLDTAEGFEFSNCGGELRRRNPQGRLKRPSGSLRSATFSPAAYPAVPPRMASSEPRATSKSFATIDSEMLRAIIGAVACASLACGRPAGRASPGEGTAPVVHPGAFVASTAVTAACGCMTCFVRFTSSGSTAWSITALLFSARRIRIYGGMPNLLVRP